MRACIIVQYGDTAGIILWTQFVDLWPQGVTNKICIGWSINILLLRHVKGGDDSLVVISKSHHLFQFCLHTAKFHRPWVPFPHPHSRLGLQFGLVVSSMAIIRFRKFSPSFSHHCNNCVVTFAQVAFCSSVSLYGTQHACTFHMFKCCVIMRRTVVLGKFDSRASSSIVL